MLMEIDKLKKQVIELQSLILINEQNRKLFSESYQTEKVKNEKLKNQIIEVKYMNSLIKMEGDIMGDSLKRLKEAISFLGEGKKRAGGGRGGRGGGGGGGGGGL